MAERAEDVTVAVEETCGPWTYVAVLDDGTERDGGDPPQGMTSIAERVAYFAVVPRDPSASALGPAIHVPADARAVFGWRTSVMIDLNAGTQRHTWRATYAGWDRDNEQIRLWLLHDGSTALTRGDLDDALTRAEGVRRGRQTHPRS